MLKFKIYKSGLIIKSWKWRAVAPNGKIIASGRGFNSQRSAVESVEILMNYCKSDKAVIEIIH